MLKTNAAIWLNKACRTKQLTPKYINISVNGSNQQSKRRKAAAVRHRINQELKFLYRKKQQLNSTLYHLHLECSNYWGGMWQHIRTNIDDQLHSVIDNTYTNLNKKLDTLTNRLRNNIDHKYHTHDERLINLTNIKFSKEQTRTLHRGLQYAVEKPPARISIR
jgi:exonuclease VII large subunit